jgi:tRNA dimethylallyltransferase
MIEGWIIPSQPIDETLRNEIQAWAAELGPERIHNVLSRLDPGAAAFIQLENVRRTIRALEVIFGTGKRFSDQRLKNPPKEQFLILGINWDRAELYRRVDSRIEVMLNTGLVEEVRHLLNSGLDPKTSAMSAIGYREIVGYLQGNYDLDEAVALIKRNTRQYIRRQANWFKTIDPRIRWFEPGEDLSVRMLGYIQNSQAD